MMRPNIWYRLDLLARQLTPFGLTLILVIINVVPLHVPGMSRVVPVLPLMAVYYWAIARPELLPAFAVFLIGALHDTLVGTPIGVNALVFLSTWGVVISQRRFFVGKAFAIVWLGFALVSAAAAVMTWALVSILNAAVMDPRVVGVQYLLTLGVFPVVAWAFSRWQQAFLRFD